MQTAPSGFFRYGAVYIPPAFVYIIKTAFIAHAQILYGNVAQIVADKIPFGAFRNSYIPHLAYIRTAVTLQADADIDIPDCRIIGKSGNAEKQGRCNDYDSPHIFMDGMSVFPAGSAK
jgi:hypothetical protein